MLLRSIQSGYDEAKRCFRESLDLAREQGAGSYELRTATDLAALIAAQGHREEAKTLLLQAYSRFTEGLETVDLRTAADLMSTLG